MDVTGLEVYVGILCQSRGVLEVTLGTCGAGLGIRRKHAVGLPSVEAAGSVTYGREDVLVTIYAGHIAVQTARHVAGGIGEGNLVGSGHLGHFVLVVTQGSTYFPFPILLVDDDAVQVGFYTTVGHGSLVGPVLAHTGDVGEVLDGQHIVRLVPEEVKTGMQTVVDERTFEGYVVLRGCLPLDGTVLDVLEVETDGVLSDALALPVGTCGIVVEVVVTALIYTGRQLQVVDVLVGLEPLLVAEYPTQLQ